MAGYAVLTVNWVDQRRSYLDTFINYALAAMSYGAAGAQDPDALVRALHQQFGLQFPVPVVRNILQRALKLGLAQRDAQDHYAPTEKGLKAIAALKPQIDALVRDQLSIASALIDWVKERYSREWNEERAATAVFRHIERNYGVVLSQAAGSGSLTSSIPVVGSSSPSGSGDDDEQLVAAWIESLYGAKSDTLDSVVDIAKGTMLVAALFSDGAIELDRSFKNTTLYLDTRILLRALGYEGDEAQESTAQYLALATSQGAELATFEFTLSETKSVLSYAIVALRKGTLWQERPGSVGAFYYRSGASVTQIDLDITQLESRISKLGVAVHPSPEYDPRFVLDEDTLQAALIEANGVEYRESARLHDLKALTAIVRQRRGRARARLEESRAVFVTRSSSLVRVARTCQEFEHEPVAVAIHEGNLVTRLWSKSPVAMPDLPRQLVLATALSVLRPSHETWGSYVREFEALHRASSIDDNDVALIRQRYEVEETAFVDDEAKRKTSGGGVSVSILDAKEVIERRLAAPLNDEVAAAHRAEDELKQQLLAREQQAEASKQELDRERADRERIETRWRQSISRTARGWGITTNIVVSVLLGSLAGIGQWPGLLPLPDWLKWMGGIVLLIALFLGGLFVLGRWAGNKVVRAVEGLLLAKHNLDEPAGTDGTSNPM
jgi:hypothetical protein